jgi:mannose/fructose/N-acetylgalactosamine-specific phosphotransferase system component IIC
MSKALLAVRTWISTEIVTVRRFLFSKTMVGAYLNAIGYACSPDFLALVPAKWAKGVQIAGGLLMALGIRHAIDKAKTPDATP